jgi:hypothetical protein
MSIIIEAHEFTEEVPSTRDPNEKFIVYCGHREKPTIAVWNMEESMFYTPMGNIIHAVTLWFKLPNARSIWNNLERSTQ